MAREPAIYVNLRDLTDSKYFKSDEQYAPNYVITESGLKVARAHVWGTIVQKFESEGSDFVNVTIDDTTETIRVMAFGDDIKLLEKVKVGDNVEIVGKVRERDGEKSILAEVVNKIEDPNEMLNIRAKILETNKTKKKTEAPKTEKREEIKEETIDTSNPVMVESEEI
ncbi:MAG: hypothetical protein JXA43_01625 [Candidatus Diapherotrites archaeon]|nr:hypothetical protein [Candidatus Diapherotrites archaeon]